MGMHSTAYKWDGDCSRAHAHMSAFGKDGQTPYRRIQGRRCNALLNICLRIGAAPKVGVSTVTQGKREVELCLGSVASDTHQEQTALEPTWACLQ